MSVDEIKDKLAVMPRNEQDEVIAYLFHLRHANDPEHKDRLGRRLTDRQESRWLTPDDFEKELDKKAAN